MKPGEKLDALVATKVMGLVVTTPWPGKRSFCCLPGSEDDTPAVVVPLYSTDIAAAWEIWKKIHTLLKPEERISLNLYGDGSGGICHEVYEKDRKIHGLIGDDYAWANIEESEYLFCLGVCEIALKAVGVEVDETG